MTKSFNAILIILAVILLGTPLSMMANSTKTVTSVSTAVTVSDDVDYVITSETPFGGGGLINIANTEHAVVILSNVKPSVAISKWLSKVQINGVKASNNSNCQVKLYNRGCIILPYGNSFKPLTVFSEQNFEGDSCNDFGLENSGGYMNTLTAAKLNNKIRSFKLKRGYMVTFSNLPNGRGYSRCFIAAYNDLEIKELPVVMDQKISSYRIFKWYDAGKKQLANYMVKEALDALNVQSSYDWAEGNSSFLPDIEWVPNHIYEDYPSSATIGGTSQSPHTKNNNEPRNSSDDHPQDLATILGNWENMMRTGLRLCSPASWDGSDYWNATGFLAEFMDSIDARGWRCDIIDLHCYWPEGNFGNVTNWANKYKRPIWISEWCWGASWNSNGAFASGVTEEQVKTALQNICSGLNNNDCVERYYYWNNERDPSRLYKSGTLTPAGEYYASMTAPMGYNGKYDFVPTTPPQYAPSGFTQEEVDDVTRLTWHDANGEFNQLMEIQKKTPEGLWQTLAVIDMKDGPADYTYEVPVDDDGVEYRLHVVYLDGKDYYSTENVATGDMLEVNGTIKYVGGNMFVNGDFNNGFSGWTNGAGSTLAEPYFEIVPKGGSEGGAYLQAHANGNLNTEKSVKQIIDLEPSKDYYFRMAVLNGTSGIRFSLTNDGTTEDKTVLSLRSTKKWERQSATFNSDTYQKAILGMRALGAKSQIDKIELRQLFDTREEAVADGIDKGRKEAEVYKAFNIAYPKLNNLLDAALNAVTTTDDAALRAIEDALDNHVKALKYMVVIDSLNAVLESISEERCARYDDMCALLASTATATRTSQIVNAVDEVKRLMNIYLDFSEASKQPRSPSFAMSTGWETKVGTYTGGDQRTNTVDGKTCWNAWWSIKQSENPDATMEVRQKLTGLEEGIYVLECKATTEHFCQTDQHGYIICDDKTVETPALTYDFFDLPVGGKWQTLTTTPIYVPQKGNITIGFVGSKHGAVDGKWHKFADATAVGDNREGWWCATDFVLRFHPVYKATVTPDQWNIICLPYSFYPGEGMEIYQIVGVTPDYTQLCLEKIDYSEAGVPCIYRSATADLMLYEYGTQVDKPINGNCNLTGAFNRHSVYVNNYYVNNGVFEKVVDSSSRPRVERNNGDLLAFDDSKAEPIPVISGWEGETMPIVGVTETEIAYNNERAQEVSYMVGDINGDDKVDVSDYIGVANHILGSTPEEFNEKAADVDCNGVIDVSDYIGVANIILIGSIFGK